MLEINPKDLSTKDLESHDRNKPIKEFNSSIVPYDSILILSFERFVSPIIDVFPKSPFFV